MKDGGGGGFPFVECPVEPQGVGRFAWRGGCPFASRGGSSGERGALASLINSAWFRMR
jgi:hypothetical protein